MGTDRKREVFSIWKSESENLGKWMFRPKRLVLNSSGDGLRKSNIFPKSPPALGS